MKDERSSRSVQIPKEICRSVGAARLISRRLNILWTGLVHKRQSRDLRKDAENFYKSGHM